MKRKKNLHLRFVGEALAEEWRKEGREWGEESVVKGLGPDLGSWCSILGDTGCQREHDRREECHPTRATLPASH